MGFLRPGVRQARAPRVRPDVTGTKRGQGAPSRWTRWIGGVSLLLGGCYSGLDDADQASGADGDESADGGDAGGDGDAPIPQVGCDGLRPGPAPLRRISDVQYRNAIDDLFFGSVAPSEDFPPTSSAFHFSSEPDANFVTDLAAEQLLMAAEDVGDQVMASVDDIAPCAAGGNDSECAAAFLDDFGPRVFRRPLRDEERALLLGAFNGGAEDGGYADGVGRMVTVALQMPAFLYLIEEGVQTDGDVIELSDYEIATRLSMLLWDTLPDDELRDLAAAGELGDADQIEVQARRLMADPRSAPALTRFAREWLGVRQLRINDKDTVEFPNYDESLIASMDEQFERFVTASFSSDDASLSRLLTSNEVEVDANLAPLYGLAGAEGWRTESLDPQRRAGILGLPAFLAAHASNLETSSIHRGLEIRTRILCQDIPAPPPGAEAQGADILPQDSTEAERTQALIDNAECGTCHRLMNPLGMAFEHYDALGAWRETYADGEAIDTEWELIGAPAGIDDATFDGAADLTDLLAGTQPVAECFTRNWMHHSYGVEPGDGEVGQCALDDMTAAFIESGESLPELIVHMTRSDAFRYRDVSGEDN